MIIHLGCDNCKEIIKPPSDFVQFDYMKQFKSPGLTEIRGMRDYYCMNCWMTKTNDLDAIILDAYALGPVVIQKRYRGNYECPVCGGYQ